MRSLTFPSASTRFKTKDQALPPTRLLASNNITENPYLTNFLAAASPAIPAPITITLLPLPTINFLFNSLLFSIYEPEAFIKTNIPTAESVKIKKFQFPIVQLIHEV